MARLTIELLGPQRIALAGGILTLRMRKDLALLAYLAVEQQHPHSRETLVGLLWPDSTEEAARNNLRVALASLRRLLGEDGDAFLHADRQHVQFLPGSDHALDVIAFRRLLADVRTHAHGIPTDGVAAPERCDACIARLAEAAALYRGDFLAGFSLPDGAPFEEWAAIEREQLHQQAFDALDTLTTAHELRGDHSAQIAYGRRQLALEPWHESAHAQVMRGLWASGQRGAALAQYEACRRILADELGVEPAPELAALAEQLRTNELKIENEELRMASTPHAQFSILNSQFSISQHNLPSPLTSFVGRADELARLAVLLAGDTRLVTLIGAGGAGKTRMALAIAWQLLPRFADGVWWVALAGVQPADDPALQRGTLASAVATALGRTLGGRRSPLDELADALHDRAVLLVLDNCEHLPEVAAVARALLEAAPKVRVVATSREPLGLGGEALLRLEGLPVPLPGAADPASYPGVQLFLERAARHTPGWGQDIADGAVARLCRLLDGLPLAIELAAHWVGHYTPDEIAEAIQADLDFLAARTRDVEGRHRSLRAVFDYAWRSLNAAEQQALMRLSVFRGSFDRAAAQAVANVRATTLVALVDKSLLQQAGVGRYSRHELLRQFAAERLGTSGDAAAMRAQHAAYYLALAEQAAPELSGPDQAPALERLDRALDNLRAALSWVREQGQTDLGLRLAGALERFWFTRGYLSEGREWLERFLTPANAVEVPPAVRAQAFSAAGLLANTQGDHIQATRWLELGLACYRAADDLVGAVRALTTLGGVAYDQGDLHGALERWEQSLAQARAVGDLGEVARALGNVGEAHFHLGDLASAAALHTEALALARQLGRTNLEAFQLGDLGNVARRQGDLVRATALHRQALELKRALGARRQIAITLEDLASVAAAEGHGTRAARLLGAATTIREVIGTPQAIPERIATEQAVAGARAALGEETWAAAFRDGLALSLDQAITYANAPTTSGDYHLQSGSAALNAGSTTALPSDEDDLDGDSDTAEPRERTSRAAIDWSYSLLNPAEQALLRRLAVFAGGCTLQSAEAVCAVESGDRRSATLELLSPLVDKSLLIVDQRHDTARYRLLETIRAYAHERLADANELDVARERHLAYFMHLAEEAEPHLFAADQVAWLDRLALEHDNMRAAIDYAMERADAPTALRLVTALRSFWYTRGHYDEGWQRILRALALPTAQAHTCARASALNAAGAILWAGGDAAQARRLLDEALAIGREIGDQLNTGWALLHMGMIAYQENDYPAAQSLLEAGLAGCRAADAAGRRGVGWALIFLGDLALHGGDTDLARSRFEESVALLRELADYGLLAYPLRRLGYLALQHGDFATATDHCAESLRLNLAIDDQLAVAACLVALAAVAFAEGRAAREGAQTTPMLRAARLCGAVGAELRRIAAPLWPADAAMFTATVAAVREYLGEVVFTAAAAEGSTIPFEQLIAECVEQARGGAAERSAVAAPPPGQRSAPVHNLPVAITPLVGRERELEALAALLRRPDVRLVTLIGLGGMGKTRLALALAETCRHDYSDGVAFVALVHLSEAASIPAAVAQALGLTLHAEDPLVTLAGWLRERELLLVLDNFEHLLDGAELLATLLQAAPRLTVLVTSRERLNLLGEHAYLVEGLAYTQPSSAVERADAAAVRLFVASAQRRRPDFAVDAANLSAILQICRQVQGMPLGLELAAAWVESLSPAEIVVEVAQSADFLTSEWRDLPERQRSIRTVFEMTWHRLSDEERQSLAQLALFRGGFTRLAARAVAGASTGILNRLVQKALLRVSASSNAKGRYELHELLRQFAEEALAAAPGGAAGARRRHAAFFAALAEEAEPQLAGADQVAWLDRLEAEHDNLRAALGWAVAGGDRLMGLRLAAALGEFWWPRGHLSEGRRWLDLLLAGPAQPAAPEAPGQELPKDAQPTVAKALASAGELAYGQGDHPRAAALLQQSLECSRQLADRRGEARALRGLSNVLAARGDQQAAALRAESLALFQAIGDHLGIAWMLLETGRSEPDPARQVALLEESLALSRAGGYPRTIATALGNLGKLARDRGEHGLARQHLREALEIGRALRDGWLCAWMLDELGVLATHQGDWRTARFLLEESTALFRQDGNERGVALVAEHLGATPGDEEGQSSDLPLLATR